MDVERNKQTIRRLFENAWNQQNFDVLPDLLVPDYAEREGNWMETVFAAFPDTQFTIEDILAEDDRVATRVIWRATHQGEFGGIAPTGASVTAPAMFIHLMDPQGIAIESWGFGGAVNFVDQIKAAIAAS